MSPRKVEHVSQSPAPFPSRSKTSDCSPYPRLPAYPYPRVCASTSIQVYIYAPKDGFAKLSTIASHQSFVTHVDFSCDGNYVQSADGANSLLFADAATGIQIPSE